MTWSLLESKLNCQSKDWVQIFKIAFLGSQISRQRSPIRLATRTTALSLSSIGNYFFFLQHLAYIVPLTRGMIPHQKLHLVVILQVKELWNTRAESFLALKTRFTFSWWLVFSFRYSIGYKTIFFPLFLVSNIKKILELPKLKITLNSKSELTIKIKMNQSDGFFLGSPMLAKLSLSIFWRLRIKTISAEKCEVTIPYFLAFQNPFKSIILLRWQELPNSAPEQLCQLALAGRGKFSMLVVELFELNIQTGKWENNLQL